MCYSTRATRKAKQLELELEREIARGSLPENKELIHFHAHGWAHPNMWIVTQERADKIIPAKWGIMPSTANGADYNEYFKNNHGAYGGLNLRFEDVFGHFMFRDNVITKRCVIPVDGFFETHTTPKPTKTPYKVPFYFKRKDDRPIYLAGMYNVTKDDMVTFSVFTNRATPLFEEIHNAPSNKHGDFRRPVCLSRDEADYWLQDDHGPDDIIDIADNDLRDDEFLAWPISKDLNKRKGEGNRFDIIDPVHDPEVKINYDRKPQQDLFG